jgi:predicted MFS family arabinose efflux permease
LAAGLSLIAVYVFTPPAHLAWMLFVLLLVPTIGVAFSDVVIDALMVEEGQPRGITGRLQSVQWAAIYGATILTGTVGGYLSEVKRQELGFLVAGHAMIGSFLIVLFAVREPRRNAVADGDRRSRRDGFRHAVAAMWRTVQRPSILTIAAFIFLWSFNPFTSAVLHMHIVRHMGFSEQFFGNTVSIQAVGAMLGSALYGLYCRRLSVMQLVHLSIMNGVLATTAYWLLDGEWSARAIAFFVGFTYMTGLIVQLDLAARVCELETAGTTFAILMSISNFAVSMSMFAGGQMYDGIAAWQDNTTAFNVVVGVGALFTCGCWLLTPAIRRYCQPAATTASSSK